MSKYGKNGVTADTPKNILFGAGTIHKNLVYTAGEGQTAGSWNFASSIIGATSGGSKVSIVPEVTKIDVDGALVATKGLSRKVGETATMEVNFIELSKELVKTATLGKYGTSADSDNFDLIEAKADIEEGDYFDNIAFVGETLDGRNIIVIMENALCTSGFDQEGKNKEGAVGKYTFECHAEITDDLDKLPWHIYYPKPVA